MLGAMKVPKVAYVFVLFVCILIYVYQKRPFQRTQNGLGFVIQAALGQPVPQDFYGIMFDAGSTGTRIHVFKFTKLPNGSPKLAHETFKALKPGLSAYSDEPHLVKEVFQLSPFLVTNDCVSIMDGTDEGISAWITVNFLIDSLHGEQRNTTGILDLGGGSTQITFLPHNEITLQTSPVNYITSIQMFNSTYTVYSHSYLGFGLMSARLAILGGTEGRPPEEGQELVSSCLSPGYKTEWKHGEIVYNVKGQKSGEPIYDSCYARVEKILYRKVHKPEEVGSLSFYAFSYYYDRAVDVGLIDEVKGGTLKVEDYGKAARHVCQSMESESTDKPFLCMDLVYITVLLEELGFQKDAVLKLARKINGVESSWALGATFHYIDSLQRN
ncbi:ectonucleoside triphosphate diphosphohydrolase 6 isoform X2 [Hemiscyllium ocellatum]|uniref:ectonucleoside triphosphate diphosphohydrolase 6 isoform X2 n=1 Tax=Hemiscyllium ocellatum TaxID=170820 RepID=UPI002965F4CB|nr:ectonucleoside triphosphate diphosphohydrolase 6 isoform X2 [Hemiscyllium ocellatum]